jgi:hypothetical protein
MFRTLSAWTKRIARVDSWPANWAWITAGFVAVVILYAISGEIVGDSQVDKEFFSLSAQVLPTLLLVSIFDRTRRGSRRGSMAMVGHAFLMVVVLQGVGTALYGAAHADPKSDWAVNIVTAYLVAVGALVLQAAREFVNGAEDEAPEDEVVEEDVAEADDIAVANQAVAEPAVPDEPRSSP